MIELGKHLEKEVITPNLENDTETLFDLPTVNYVDKKGNHWITNGIGGIVVVIENKDWNKFLDNLYTIYYRKSVLGDKIPVREKLDPLDWKTSYLYQLGYNHKPNFANHQQKFLDVRTIHSLMKVRCIETTRIEE
jgi:hypothetical protein